MSRTAIIPGVVIILLLASTAVLLTSHSSLMSSREKLSIAIEKRNSSVEGLAYACGYLAGQRAIIERAKLPIAPPRDVNGCDERRAVARQNGFSQDPLP